MINSDPAINNEKEKVELCLEVEFPQRVRVQAGGVAEGEGEVSSLFSWEPDMGLDPRTLGL